MWTTLQSVTCLEATLTPQIDRLQGFKPIWRPIAKTLMVHWETPRHLSDSRQLPLVPKTLLFLNSYRNENKWRFKKWVWWQIDSPPRLKVNKVPIGQLRVAKCTIWGLYNTSKLLLCNKKWTKEEACCSQTILGEKSTLSRSACLLSRYKASFTRWNWAKPLRESKKTKRVALRCSKCAALCESNYLCLMSRHSISHSLRRQRCSWHLTSQRWLAKISMFWQYLQS